MKNKKRKLKIFQRSSSKNSDKSFLNYHSAATEFLDAVDESNKNKSILLEDRISIKK